jgi:hypothetical protein
MQVNTGEQQNGVKSGAIVAKAPEAVVMPRYTLKPTAAEFKPLFRVMYGLSVPELCLS